MSVNEVLVMWLKEVDMKRAAVFFAMLLGFQALVSLPSYAREIKAEMYYPGGGQRIEKQSLHVDWLSDTSHRVAATTPVSKPAPVIPVSGKTSHAPNPFSCDGGGFKFEWSGATVRTVYCN